MARRAVFYLSRWSNDPRFAKAFLRSLGAFPAGADFELVYFLKGFPPSAGDANLSAFKAASAQRVHELRAPDATFPTNLYLETAAKSDYETILFLISYSRILAPNWLSHYLSAFDANPDCGVVGATGGYERIERDQPFPNVNIRTNAFMMDRHLLASLEPGDLTHKAGGNNFEAGRNSLTRQLMNRGLAPLVIDRRGQTWRWETWPQSRTFRAGEQEGLLIADNRTQDYQSAGLKRRRKLARLNWGETSMVSRPSPWARLRSHIEWRWPGAWPQAKS